MSDVKTAADQHRADVAEYGTRLSEAMMRPARPGASCDGCGSDGAKWSRSREWTLFCDRCEARDFAGGPIAQALFDYERNRESVN